jgi:Transposase DDE domain
MKSIGARSERGEPEICAVALNPVRGFLTDELVQAACRESEFTWRRRLWTPLVTVLACVYRHLCEHGSARGTEDWLASLGRDAVPGMRQGSAFCEARKRLPCAVLNALADKTGAAAHALAGRLLQGLRICLFDGSTLRVPNSKDNERAFGRSENQSGPSRSPLARLALLVCAGSGAVLSFVAGTYRTSENAMILESLLSQAAGRLLVGDGVLCSYVIMALVQARQGHVLTRARKKRTGHRLKRLGRKDELWEWKRPRAAHVAQPEYLSQCPEVLQVRLIECVVARKGYRDWTLTLATTLLDPKLFPADVLAHEYSRRWDIEVDLRTLKGGYGLARLTGKSEQSVRKEIASALLAYNCVRNIQARSGKAPRTLSQNRTRQHLVRFAERMATAPARDLPQLYQNLLKLVAATKIATPERPPHPRAVLQRPHTFPLLTITRHEWQRNAAS